MGRRTNYSEDEAQELLKRYQMLRARQERRLNVATLVKLADIDRALARIPIEYWAILLLVGLVGLSQAEAAVLMEKSQSWVSKRYRLAIEELVYLLNGGT